MPGPGYTPFTVLNQNKVSDGGEQTRAWEGAKMWSDGVLKQRASALDRTVLAIGDAAHIVFKKGGDPRVSPVYITLVIRKAWGLSAKELSKQLGRLVEEGVIIRSGAKTKGRHARFTLAPTDTGGGFSGVAALSYRAATCDDSPDTPP